VNRPIDGPPEDATSRFSSRVDNYARYRPRYPAAVIDLLRTECQLASDAIIADIGSGTGILSELLLRNGNPVYGIEPNREMREAGERLLRGYADFRSVNSTAEATTLEDGGVEFVVAGQAFHWFDLEKSKTEFARILKPDGWVVLVWNMRVGAATPFGRDYEALLHTYATDYAKVNHKRIDDAAIDGFFGGDVQARTFENCQYFDFEGLRGRLLSSSYSPEPGDPNYASMLSALKQLFTTYNADGQVAFEYATNVYFGRPG
jgi:SAM-dependent methyltransferase